MTVSSRLSTGIAALDEHLGGGLLPGTLTVIAGATGIGKTQLGLSFLNAGLAQEGRRGIVFDMSARGDSQSHAEYARRFGWELYALSAEGELAADAVWEADGRVGDYLNLFREGGTAGLSSRAGLSGGPPSSPPLVRGGAAFAGGRRVTRRDMDFDDWRAWKAQLVRQLGWAIYFFYGNFIRGVRRAVIDGIEPVDRPSESIQFDLFEYIYHQILRKDAEWVARDLLREKFRANEAEVKAHPYDPRAIACVLLATTRESMLEDLIGRRLDEGDVLSNANTVIYLGRVRDGTRLRRALYIAKHRGSYCSEEIVPYRISEVGIAIG